MVIPADRETGRTRGYAPVEFEEKADADAIQKFNGYVLGGRTLRMSAEERPRGGGSGDAR